jgi:hypothetical protein
VAHSVEVRCGDCGRLFSVSGNIDRKHKRRGSVPMCSECRRVDLVPDLTEKERQTYLTWWEHTYSPAELEKLGRDLSLLAPVPD